MLRLLAYGLIASLMVACGDQENATEGGNGTEAEASQGALWTVFQDQGALFVKAGRSSGLVKDSAVTILGSPVAGTNNRRIIGYGNVAEIWDDMVRIKPTRLDDTATGQGMAARRPEKSDLAVVTELPKI